MNDASIIETIKSYWGRRGYDVDIGVREYGFQTPNGSIYKSYAIRSNMVDGLPQWFHGERDIACSIKRR